MEHLFILLAKLIDNQLARYVQYLKVENDIYRARFGKSFHTRPHERRKLLKFGKPLGADLKKLINIVTYSTFLRWIREEQRAAGKAPPRKKGRRRTKAEIEALVVRIARENIWGYTRTFGEMKKLRIFSLCRTTIRNILQRNGVDPEPTRGDDTWNNFIKRHFSTLYACDFFTKPVWTLYGKVTYYVLFFIHVETRKVYITGMTPNPTQPWVTQQARNFVMQLENEGKSLSVLIRDGDGKFSKNFDNVFKSIGGEVKRLPYKSPNLNPYAESWVGTVKRECLNKFLCFGEDHLRYILKEYLAYYNTVRPHGSLGRPIDYEETLTQGEVVCEKRLGGLIKHYYRRKAA